MEHTAGQVVYSKSGHDKGKAFIIIEAEGEYVYLADGRTRTIEKPKKKKLKHVQITNYSDQELKDKIENRGQLLNADFVKALKRYSNNNRAQ